jgi:hypothetical protein
MTTSHEHVVRDGEDVGSIAARCGFFWKTIWDHADNALKGKREDPMVLHPEDRIVIPELRIKQFPAADSQRHRFRRRGIPAELKLRFLDEGKPRANVPCSVEIDGVTTELKTDGDGVLTIKIPPDASGGEIAVGEGEECVVYAIELGTLSPPDSVRGLQKRLRNLGFYAGAVDGTASDELTEALRSFQQVVGIGETGEACEDTCKRLKEMNGS